MPIPATIIPTTTNSVSILLNMPELTLSSFFVVESLLLVPSHTLPCDWAHVAYPATQRAIDLGVQVIDFEGE